MSKVNQPQEAIVPEFRMTEIPAGIRVRDPFEVEPLDPELFKQLSDAYNGVVIPELMDEIERKDWYYWF